MIEEDFKDGKRAALKLVVGKYQVAQTLPSAHIGSQASGLFTFLLITENILEQAHFVFWIMLREMLQKLLSKLSIQFKQKHFKQ